MLGNEWLDDETVVTDEDLNVEAPVVETLEEYGNVGGFVAAGVPAPPEPEEGQNNGEEVGP